ncbi:MAG TPA: ABC transporter permease, partial [Candidatus Acidoferrales bacterium]|nr:ABC transporter permease [Candidatus Acidoferrales bacterium]
MSPLRSLASGLRALLHKRRTEHDLGEELDHYLESAAAEKMKAGLSRDQALRAARLEMRASTEGVKEAVRASTWENLVETLWHDLRYALRQLRRSPGFATVAILTLALGIGANTAIFSLINSIMLRPLPVRDPQNLYLLRWHAQQRPRAHGYSPGNCEPGTLDFNKGCSFSYPMYEQLRSHQDVFSQLAAFVDDAVLHLVANGETTRISGRFVSGNFFSTLGVRPAVGRLIVPTDDAPAAPPVAVLSYRFWQAQFAGNRSIIGKTVGVEGGLATIIGVAPAEFTGLNPGISRDMWLPLSGIPALNVDQGYERVPTNIWLQIVGRPRRGVTEQQAASASSLIFARSAISDALFKPSDAPGIDLMGLHRGLLSLRNSYSQQLFLVLGVVGIILLIACANVAGLSLARAASRRKEIGVRLALGAGRARVARQLLTESMLLALLGGAAGVLVAYWGAEALAAQIASHSYNVMQLHLRPDAHVLGFTFAVAALVGIVFGLAPALRGTRVDLAPSLKASGAQSAALRGGGRFGLGGALVVAQVALAIVVLAGAGLLIRTLVNLNTAKLGFDPQNVLLFGVAQPWAPHQQQLSPEQQSTLSQELRDRFASLPGVVSASYDQFALIGEGSSKNDFRLPGTPEDKALPSKSAAVGEGFFSTMRIPLLAGRDFTPADFNEHAKPHPIIINRTLAHRLFGSRNPLGRRLLGGQGADRNVAFQVVGVVADAKYGTLRDDFSPVGYMPLTWWMGGFELRAAVDPAALIPAIRATAKSVDPRFAATGFQKDTAELADTLHQERLFAWLGGLFAALALLLACIALYGLLAYDVARRVPEIGLRMALGAQPNQIVGFVIGRGIALAAIGTVVGGAITLALARYIRALLYG